MQLQYQTTFLFQHVFSLTNLSVRAEASNLTSSVSFSLTGALNTTQTENIIPYALFGDRSSDYSGREFIVGEYSISATPYAESRLSGEEGISLSLDFSVIDTTPPLEFAITSFVLVDADTDADLFEITAGILI